MNSDVGDIITVAIFGGRILGSKSKNLTEIILCENYLKNIFSNFRSKRSSAQIEKSIRYFWLTS